MSSPTVVPMTPLDPQSDAGILRRAIIGSSVDSAAIISLLTNRSSDQRQEILHHYKHTFGHELRQDLKNVTSGDFQTVIMALMTPMNEYLAQEIHRALGSRGAKERTLIEILCTRDNASIRAIKDAFYNLYSKSLEEMVQEGTSGSFQELLLALCSCCREERQSESAAIDVAKQLYLAAPGEPQLMKILTSVSHKTLRKIFQEYNRLAGKSFGNLLEEEVAGDSLKGMLAVYSSIQNPAVFFAEALHGSMVGLGTRDRTLIRLVVSRSEIDMGDIKVQYHNLYGRTLEKDIKGDTSGDYKRTLLALIGVS
ncbi:annexin B11-like isoform X1 [Palaemon carinicauda]|uniref:annexin B11-like isoform X1 n=1 Tax=Palaemon carinicauda TaxID=392227 RepID=UPI0035B5E8A1